MGLPCLHIADQSIDPETLHAEFRKGAGDSGAIVAFTGIVREEGDITALTLSHYAGFTEAEIIRIGQDAAKRWPLAAWHITHRVGEMLPGDPIVFVATASRHRRAAFEAADFLMDYLKSKAPFWKKEQATSGEANWVDARETDETSIKRWQEE